MGRAVEAFQLLGIPPDSDRDAITHAYRRLARTVHPDVSADADATQRFVALAEAYRIATTAPAGRLAAPAGGEVPVRWTGGQSMQDAPIVAGPVRVGPPSAQGEGRRHG